MLSRSGILAVFAVLTVAMLPAAQSAEPVAADPQYTAAYRQFRLLQEAVLAKRPSDAKKAGQSCVGTLDDLIKRQPRSFEALALQSACYGYLANLGGFAAIGNGTKSGKSIEAALAIAPKHPRVILVDGFGVYFRPKFVGGDTNKGCARFKEAARAFDALPQGGAATAGSTAIEWGAADAHYWSGRCARDAGDAATARAEFEKALALDPAFAPAKRALGR